MANVYKVNITFQGTASLQIEAETPEAARLKAQDLTIPDIARAGQVDVRQLKVAAREVTPVAAMGGLLDGSEDEASPSKPRPSGWYRPA
jgi:hypothetical protein